MGKLETRRCVVVSSCRYPGVPLGVFHIVSPQEDTECFQENTPFHFSGCNCVGRHRGAGQKHSQQPDISCTEPLRTGGGLQGPGACLMGAFRTLCVRCYAEKFSPYPKCLQFASVFAGGHSVREQGRPGKFCGYKTGLCQTVLSGFANFPASMLVTNCTDRAERKAAHCCFGFGRTLCDWDLMQ